MSILFIFLKSQFLVLLIFPIAFLLSISFISALIFIHVEVFERSVPSQSIKSECLGPGISFYNNNSLGDSNVQLGLSTHLGDLTPSMALFFLTIHRKMT